MFALPTLNILQLFYPKGFGRDDGAVQKKQIYKSDETVIFS
jgi:hypothetical protein